MRTATGTQEQIESYLSRLRAGLRGLNEQDAQDIVEELRSHITDKMAVSGEVTPAGIDAVLGGLGSPEELAQQYVTDQVLARTEASRSPLQIIKNTFRWASLSVGGLFVLLGSLMGYAAGLLLLLWAALKPLHPRTAGLWASRDSTGDLLISVHVWAGSAAPGSRDVLGWWIVPLGVLAGCGCDADDALGGAVRETKSQTDAEGARLICRNDELQRKRKPCMNRWRARHRR